MGREYIGARMNGIVEIRPVRSGGYTLEFRDISVWYAREDYAIQYAQEICRECDIVVYYGDGTIKHRYSGRSPIALAKLRG